MNYPLFLDSKFELRFDIGYWLLVAGYQLLVLPFYRSPPYCRKLLTGQALTTHQLPLTNYYSPVTTICLPLSI
ncbi:MAG: hypothetical protein IIB44_01350 [Candidatus Marinimicrobia bacterium]|nr:hypothetical protein [Candidatus Neomarinimicrobiota bacterium]